MIHRLEVDLASDTPESGPSGRVWVLARWGDRALGEILIDNDHQPSPEEFRRRVMEPFLAEIHACRTLKARPEGSISPGDLSVILEPGRSSDTAVEACLEDLKSLSPPPGEIVICEPLTGTTPGSTRSARERSVAIESRNIAWINSLGGAVLFIDPNCRPELSYMASLARVFEPDGVGAVTSLVSPYSLDNETQLMFDRRTLPHRIYEGGFLSSKTLVDFDPLSVHPGIGGAVSYRRQSLEQIGGFSDHGSPTIRQAEYTVLARLFRDGWAIRHQVEAVLRHQHPATPSDADAWLRQFAYDQADYRRSHPMNRHHLQPIHHRIWRRMRALSRGDVAIRRRLAMASGVMEAMVTRGRSRPR